MNINQVAARGPMHLVSGFYVAMAAIALYGQSDGLMLWLGLDRWPAIAVGAAIELLAAVLFAFADWRRTHHGEKALAARTLSIAVALGVAAMNFYGHTGSLGTCALFTGASLAGYAVWVLHTNARRRDALRAAGRLPAPAPSYGPGEWLRRPKLVWRARMLAIVDSNLGVHESLQRAADDIAVEHRHAAIAKALRRKLSTSLDPVSADIAMVSYDLDKVAARLAATVDYTKLTALLADDISPDKVRAGRSRKTTEAPSTDDSVSTASSTTKGRVSTGRGVSTTDRVAKVLAKTPEASTAQIAAKLGLSERTVQRHLAKTETSIAVRSAADLVGATA